MAAAYAPPPSGEADTPYSSDSDAPAYSRSVKDPIHDYITLHPRSWAFVDTRQFQRLRSIKQLGVSYYVWPGASHNRFEHCLGVAHLARLQVEHLQRSQPELGITERDVECVELAGLCHDLGHGPWSHVWDCLFIPLALPGKKWRHEDASEMMFDYLRLDNAVQMSDADALFVKALIVGSPERCGHKEKAFLFEIVANKRNGIDVDKFDYIARDTHAIGEKINISMSRLIRSARVIDNQICYDIKDANQIYELFYTRFSLHKRIYNHKTSMAIAHMITDGLLKAEPFLKLAERINKPEQYLYLTDEILGRIESSTDPELSASRALFERLRSRDLYKYVDYKVVGWHLRDICKAHITPDRIVEVAKAWASSPSSPSPQLSFSSRADRVPASVASLTSDDVIVHISTMHYGMREKNPLDSVKFYSKHRPDQASQAGPGDISSLMPAVFAELMLRVYTRQAKYFGIVQAGFRQVLKSMPDSADPTPASPSKSRQRETAPAEAPPTPRTQSGTLSDATASPPSSQPSLPFSSGTVQRPLPSADVGRAPSPLSRENTFTTVPVNFVPTSPMHRARTRGRGQVLSAAGEAGASAGGGKGGERDVIRGGHAPDGGEERARKRKKD